MSSIKRNRSQCRIRAKDESRSIVTMAALLSNNVVEKMFGGERVSKPVVQLITLKHAIAADPNAPKRVK